MKPEETLTLFVYGTLMNENELKKIFKETKKLTPATLTNHRRIWNVGTTKKNEQQLHLGIYQHTPGQLNGATTKITKTQLKTLLKQNPEYTTKTITTINPKNNTQKQAITLIATTKTLQKTWKNKKIHTYINKDDQTKIQKALHELQKQTSENETQKYKQSTDTHTAIIK